jgi:hypothetical protein
MYFIGWLHREQREIIGYLREVNRMRRVRRG